MVEVVDGEVSEGTAGGTRQKNPRDYHRIHKLINDSRKGRGLSCIFSVAVSGDNSGSGVNSTGDGSRDELNLVYPVICKRLTRGTWQKSSRFTLIIKD